MTVYTGRGDEGMTDLRDGSRVSKSSDRIEAYGTVDELNALLGRIRPTGYEDIDGSLRTAQQHLHILQADLANPDPDVGDPMITMEHVEVVEGWIDQAEAHLDPLDAFVLPGGGEAGSRLHHARTVCRRVERRIVALDSAEGVRPPSLVYVNRLSDALFVFARLANGRDGIEEESPSY
ncbi:MAG: cob(I)yrinic acid a,c-diamide adenosyltransferase [Halodesulfurarchaeum sp.]